MKTLVIVDVQNDFMPGGALAVPDGDAIVPVINRLMGDYDLVVASQDWHPKGHGSFASSHEGRAQFEEIMLHGEPQTLWPDHCVQGSEGARLHKDLDARPIEAIFRKGLDPEVDSYSAFFDNNHARATGLSGYLREKGAMCLDLVGLAGDVCVGFTALDGLREGFDVRLVEPGIRALDDEAYGAMKRRIADKGGKMIELL
ncbi:bifunctional nicotinamidase/pyrazinamidase [Yunchengibacter salinarum]|uniref:bifunctional nicotinamidase/pyrazinamidase n=1 Tax=Yunchengibacter salinarum TaxID=3133399 RepID=UPI0035B6334A